MNTDRTELTRRMDAFMDTAQALANGKDPVIALSESSDSLGTFSPGHTHPSIINYRAKTMKPDAPVLS